MKFNIRPLAKLIQGLLASNTSQLITTKRQKYSTKYSPNSSLRFLKKSLIRSTPSGFEKKSSNSYSRVRDGSIKCDIKSAFFKKAFFILLAVLVLFNIVKTINFDRIHALSKLGSRGDEVRQIQEKLKSLGYNVGAVDSIYGSMTEAAVKKYQQDNGLTGDGIAGPITLGRLGISSTNTTNTTNTANTANTPNNAVNSGDKNLLARMISAEARGEVYVGQVAVGAVILNRVKHPSFPNTVSGVIYQPGAFSSINDGQFNQPVSASANNAATDAMNGWDPTGGAIYFYNPAKTSNQWMLSRPVVYRVGGHVFTK